MERHCGTESQSLASRADIIWFISERPFWISLNLSDLVKIILCQEWLCVYKIMSEYEMTVIEVTERSGGSCTNQSRLKFVYLKHHVGVINMDMISLVVFSCI